MGGRRPGAHMPLPASGSRRAATGVRNDRGARPETVEDHDPGFARRQPLTWRFPRALTVLNSTEFHGETPNADLARTRTTTGTWRWGRRVGTAAPSGRWWVGWSDRRVSRLAGLPSDGHCVQRQGQHGGGD